MEIAGSSPLARGLRLHLRLHILNIGIIPARAGFTGAVLSTLIHTRDHPRSRGVYMLTPLLALMRKGSSPLARGLLSPMSALPIVNGIIPARAGFTAGLSA